MMSAGRLDTGYSLGALLGGWAAVGSAAERPITGIAMDSRRVQPGDLFLACAGLRGHGAQFAESAVDKGAAAVAMEVEAGGAQGIGERIQRQGRVVPVVHVVGLRELAGEIASRFYGHPSRKLWVAGVTGTNGKTTVSQLAAAALNVDAPCGVIGTLGSGLVGRLESDGHTTPDPVTLQARFGDFVAAGARYAVMEVSSHGLDQGRINGVDFDAAVFTNLTHDHLDYHGDMAAYALAKRRLFEPPGLRAAVINADDPVGREWLRGLPAGVEAVGFGLEAPGEALAIRGRNLRLGPEGLMMTVSSPGGEGVLRSPLLGRFNASNLLATLGILLAAGLPLEEALARLAHAPAVAGRMERFGGVSGKPLVVVDYAHTPDALVQVLGALREHCRGRLWCVFGCGGDRDRAKRPVMGEVAERLADWVILTDDNPRGEDPEAIIADIRRGMAEPERVQVLRDRAHAITQAVGAAGEGDVVLVAGKGHEAVQQIGDRCIPFSDRAVVAGLLGGEVAQDG